MENVTERWLPVVGFEGRYEVSDLGRLRALPRTTIDSNGDARQYPARPIKGIWCGKYRRAVFYVDGKKVRPAIHRIVLEAFVGPCPPDMEGCHNDADTSNNKLSNLRWDTTSANNLDVVASGNHGEARKTHCKWGHAFDEKNTHIIRRFEDGRVWRECRRCGRERKSREKARQKTG